MGWQPQSPVYVLQYLLPTRHLDATNHLMTRPPRPIPPPMRLHVVGTTPTPLKALPPATSDAQSHARGSPSLQISSHTRSLSASSLFALRSWSTHTQISSFLPPLFHLFSTHTHTHTHTHTRANPLKTEHGDINFPSNTFPPTQGPPSIYRDWWWGVFVRDSGYVGLNSLFD